MPNFFLALSVLIFVSMQLVNNAKSGTTSAIKYDINMIHVLLE